MTAVVDVSGIAQILFQQGKMDKFDALLLKADMVLAPDLFVPELSNTLWKYQSAGKYSPEECNKLMEDGLGYIDELIDSREIWREALAEGIKNKHPVYDMYYAVIARRNDGILITNDGDLARICKKQNIKVCF